MAESRCDVCKRVFDTNPRLRQHKKDTGHDTTKGLIDYTLNRLMRKERKANHEPNRTA